MVSHELRNGHFRNDLRTRDVSVILARSFGQNHPESGNSQQEEQPATRFGLPQTSFPAKIMLRGHGQQQFPGNFRDLTGVSEVSAIIIDRLLQIRVKDV